MPPHSIHNLREQPANGPLTVQSSSSLELQANPHAQGWEPGHKLLFSPCTFAGAVALMLRADQLFALLMPTFCGIALAWWEVGQVNILRSLFTLFSVTTYLLAIHLIAEYRDYHFSMGPEGKYVDERPFAGSSLLIRKLFLPNTVLGFSIILLMVSMASLAWLVLLAGWPVLFFLGLAGLLYCLRMVPPPMHGYLAWGLGEVGCFIGVGLLQLLNGYYVQSGVLTALPFYVSIPAGFLAVLTPFAHELIYRRRDWISRKRTFPVALGDKRSLNFSALLILATYSSFFVLVVAAAMPLSILISLVALPIMLGGFKQMHHEQPTPVHRYLFYKATVKGSILTWLLFLFALWIDKVV